MSNYVNSCKEPNALALVLNRIETISSNGLVSKTVVTIRTWVDRYKQRRHLAALPPHMLEDIGITAKQQIEEASKPFWIQ